MSSEVIITDGHWRKSLAAVRALGKKGIKTAVGESTRVATSMFSKYCRRGTAGEMNNRRAEKILMDITDYHMSPVEAGEIAQEAGVKKLVLVHVVPPVENFIIKRMFLAGVDDVFDGEIILGEDRMTFELPPKE